MFDIGFSELLLIFIIGLVVLGPKRLTPPDVFSQTLLAICHPASGVSEGWLNLSRYSAGVMPWICFKCLSNTWSYFTHSRHSIALPEVIGYRLSFAFHSLAFLPPVRM